ncbi:hypothetical protein QBC44DRAFT_304121 [Cladorrhinum sp. PSN332]|nr:hypothetical protein QBC44DRAFT_304121 [Cladorrhinum sp. PSN332]
MQLSCLLATLVVFISRSLAAPTQESTHEPQPALELLTGADLDLTRNVTARSGWRKLTVYSGSGCTGTAWYIPNNFNCEGTCWYTPGDIWSIKLEQQWDFDPRPTADLYATSDCNNQVAHAGIWYGYTVGCTNLGSAARSFKPWYNC